MRGLSGTRRKEEILARHINVRLEKRDVSCVAELLDDLAPKTCEAVWKALPQGGQAVHAKYANNEVYTLVPPFADEEPGLENPTLTPAEGDLLYFYFGPGLVNIPHIREVAQTVGVVDLAIFYAPDNLLLSPKMGPTPGTRFARIVENMAEIAEACDNVWREGFVGETLTYSRVE